MNQLLAKHIKYYVTPSELTAYFSDVLRLREALNTPPVVTVPSGESRVSLGDDLVPIVIRVILTARRKLSASIEADQYIDDFKALNTEYGESVVDRDVLPRFMRAVETEMFIRGFAYRFGGDEYVTLLPNADTEQAIAVHNSIRVAVAGLAYTGIARKTTVSLAFAKLRLIHH